MKPITFLLFLLSLCSAEKEPKHLCSRGKSVERWISNSSTLSLNQSKIDISFYDISIDINFDLIRSLPINLLFDNLRYGFQIAGVQPDINKPYFPSKKPLAYPVAE